MYTLRGILRLFNRLPPIRTYGETAEEALETLSDIADEFFCEINEVYLAEEFA
ncbi:hypothetical protein NXV03_03020 [Phocaeicola vulgatus]|nr:hypothetical protein [Phocaeicola vulgatus]MCS2369448.1 hypothetical protein [Phocaeicola vulgatus]